MLAVSFAGRSAAAEPGPFTLLHTLLDSANRAYPDLWLGHSLRMSGDLAVVGVSRTDGVQANVGSARVYNVATGELLYTLTNPFPAEMTLFAHTVAISENWVFVGVPSDAIGTNASGSVFAYDLASANPEAPVFRLRNPTNTAPDSFGLRLAAFGSKVVVGARDAPPGTDSPGRVYIFDVAGATPTAPIVILDNPNPLPIGGFGLAVGIHGKIVVVGNPNDSTSGNVSGIAFVYDIAGATPSVPKYTLQNPMPGLGRRFGDGVAVSGSRIVVGSLGGDSVATGAGSAYLYDLNHPSPALPVTTLWYPNAQSGDAFGVNVGISGTRVIVSAFQKDIGAVDSGSAYLYDLASPTPNMPVLVLTNPSPGQSDYFGYDVAISGSRFIVGAHQDDTGGDNSGRAYAYDWDSAIPEAPTFTWGNPAAVTDMLFGSAVAVAGTRVAVGGYSDDTGATNAGRVHIFDLGRAAPTEPVLVLTNPSPAMEDWFGFSAAISGARVVVGAHQDDAGAMNAGSAYVYDLGGANPMRPIVTLTNPTPAAGDVFGYAVGISGSRVIVGADFDDTGALNAGSAYVYDLSGATPGVPVLRLGDPAPAVADRFGTAVALSGSRAVVGVLFEDTGAANAGGAHVFDLDSATPTQPVATLNNPTPASDDRFGSAVAISGNHVIVALIGMTPAQRIPEPPTCMIWRVPSPQHPC